MGDVVQIKRPITAEQAWKEYLDAHDLFLAEPRSLERSIAMIRAHERFKELFLKGDQR